MIEILEFIFKEDSYEYKDLWYLEFMEIGLEIPN